MSAALQILLVEDNPADAELTSETMRAARVPNELHVVRDGEQAMSFLRKEGQYAAAPTPDLILLDLNLPKMDGREVLCEIKADEHLRMIPVVVLTSSDAPSDVRNSYGLHCNAYVRKPVGLQGYADIVGAIDAFWFNVVRLPARRP